MDGTKSKLISKKKSTVKQFAPTSYSMMFTNLTIQ